LATLAALNFSTRVDWFNIPRRAFPHLNLRNPLIPRQIAPLPALLDIGLQFAYNMSAAQAGYRL
jgi:hypothetical protein